MKYKSFAIIVTFFSLWMSVNLNATSQEVVALFFIFSFGILHGSNDLSLLAKVNTFSKYTRIRLYIASYVLTVVVASLFFYFTPTLALIGFIIFSAYHFGEQHWSTLLNSTKLSYSFLFLCYGLSLLFLLFTLNSTSTSEIITTLTGIENSDNFFLSILIVSSVCWLATAIFLVFRNAIKWQDLVFEIFMILVFAIVFYTATLVWAFAIYFIFWHSIPSILEQQQFLYKEVTLKTFLAYLKSSVLIWILSISGMVLVYIWLKDAAIFLPLLFAFLGAITFAHSFTITRMFKLKNSYFKT